MEKMEKTIECNYKENTPEWNEWQYSCSRWTKRNMTEDEVLSTWYAFVINASEKARNEITNKDLNVPYADCERTKIDIFYAESSKRSENGPVLVFIPGGYWTQSHKDNYSYIATHLIAAGITTIIVGYDRAPKVTLDAIIEEVKNCLVFVFKRFNKSKIYVSGWSAGGHLTATLLATDWTQYGLTNDVIKGAIILSGVFDIRPLLITHVNDPLHLTSEDAKRMSPMLSETKVFSKCKVLVVLGEEESPEFHRQSKEYTQAIRNEGIDCEYYDVPGVDHFTLLSELHDANYELTKKFIEFVNSDCLD